MTDVGSKRRVFDLRETRDSFLPYAEPVDADMFRELSDLVENREQMVRLMD